MSRGSSELAAAEQVTRLDLTRRRIEFVVCIAETKVRQNASGRLVIRVMPGIQSGDAECCEGARNNRRSSFAGKAAPPECDAELEAQLVDSLGRFVRLKPAAADVFPGFE
jgi:hypothetical protein